MPNPSVLTNKICLNQSKVVYGTANPEFMRQSELFHNLYVWFKYDLGQKYQAPQVRPDQGSNS